MGTITRTAGERRLFEFVSVNTLIYQEDRLWTKSTEISKHFTPRRSFCETVTVAWQLRDVEAGMGGFACVPGSHKTQYPMPRGIRECDDTMGIVAQPVMKAGSVLFFMDGGCSHGALAWRHSEQRRAVLVKYQSRNNNWGGGAIDPRDRWAEQTVDGMTEAEFAVMRGPERYLPSSFS